MRKHPKRRLKMDGDWRITLPEEIRKELGIESTTKVFGQIVDGYLHITIKRDLTGFDAAVKKWAGTGRAKMLADGFKSVDEYMDCIRPRD